MTNNNIAEVIRCKYILLKMKGRITEVVTKILLYAISSYATVIRKSAVLCYVSLSCTMLPSLVLC
jgi:hypothetical protein